MLSALGISSKRPDANSLQPRLLTLIKDTRGWPDVCALFLKTVPPETPLKGVKDKKLLEAFLSLIEAQLFPYPSINAATNDLLYATGRILATRPLHARARCPHSMRRVRRVRCATRSSHRRRPSAFTLQRSDGSVWRS